MPGIKEQHLKQNAGLRNGQWLIGGPSSSARFYSNTDISSLTTGLLTLSTTKGFPYPRTVSVQVLTGGGTSGATSVTVKLKGLDQFFVPVEDTITCSASGASATTTTEGVKVFAQLDSAEVTAISGAETDTLRIGLAVQEENDLAIIYGLPMKLKDAGDLLPAFKYDHSETPKVASLLPATYLTFMKDVNGVKLKHEDAALGGHTDRFVILQWRSNFHGRS